MTHFSWILLLFCAVSLSVQTADPVNSCSYDPYNVLPVPKRSQQLNLNVTLGYYVEKLTSESGADGVYFFTTGSYNTFFIVAPSGDVLLVDAITPLQKQAIQDVTRGNVTHFIYSHVHTDHNGYANDYLGAEFIGHEQTAYDLLARNAGGGPVKLPVPTTLFCDNYTLTFGNYKVELSYYDVFNAHTPGNILINVPEAKVFMTVDIIYPRWMPFHRLGETENITALLGNIDKILEFPFEMFIGGHVGVWGTRGDVKEGRKFYVELMEVANETNIADPTPFFDLFYGADQNSWNAVRAWYDTAACNCQQIMVDRWGHLLGAVDIYVGSACAQLQSQMRLDTSPLYVAYPTEHLQEECEKQKEEANP